MCSQQVLAFPPPMLSLGAPPAAARPDEGCQPSAPWAARSGLAARTNEALNLALISFGRLMFATRVSALFGAR